MLTAPIHTRVAWPTGDNGTMDLFSPDTFSFNGCSSAYGLCE